MPTNLTDRFDEAFRRTIGHEGKYSNNPKDNGGETMFGVTVAVARENGYTGPMRDMPLAVAKQIYRKNYWNVIKGDELPEALSFFVFDIAVNSGVGRAAKMLQRAIGVLPDGAIGPKTLAAANSRPVKDIVRLMFVERAKLFAHHADLDEFENGWFARLFDTTLAYFFDSVKPHIGGTNA